uniref:M superfamily MMSK group conopeptide Bt+Vr3-3-VP02 n=1 Tax=Conus betulinus TaxID=89764 RepID=H2BKW3_CONBE|nr:M superfamily MMSK group conopeptide Bt+Vr3-3-VP02 [Conus betulinus]
MMSKLGVLLTICMLLFPLAAFPLDGDQPADQPAERMQYDMLRAMNPWFDPIKRCRCEQTCGTCVPCC